MQWFNGHKSETYQSFHVLHTLRWTESIQHPSEDLLCFCYSTHPLASDQKGIIVACRITQGKTQMPASSVTFILRLWGGAVSYCLGSKFSRVSSLKRAKEMNCTWVWSTVPVWRYWKSLQYELPTIGQLKAEIWVRKFLDWLIPLSGTTSSEATSVNHFKNFGKVSFNVREDLKENYTLVWGRRNQPMHVFYSFIINETSLCDLNIHYSSPCT